MTQGRERAQTKADVRILMCSLLRSPKTQKGLVAAARAKGFPRHWVYGWLASAQTKGIVIRVWGGDEPQFMLASEDPARAHKLSLEGLPAWMSPPPPPPYSARRLYRLGDDDPVPQEQKIKDELCKPRKKRVAKAKPARKPPTKTRIAPRGSSST